MPQSHHKTIHERRVRYLVVHIQHVTYGCSPCSVAAGTDSLRCNAALHRRDHAGKTALRHVNGHRTDQKEASYGTGAVHGVWRTTNCSCNERYKQHKGQRYKRKAQRTPAYAISTLIYRASYVSNGPPDDDSVPLVPTAVPSDVSFVPPKIGCSCCCSTAQFSTIEKGGGFPVNASSG